MAIASVISLGLVGAAMGSFIGALTWRLKHRKNFVTGRSECEKCHHQLAAIDLVPIVSWLVLRGRCRYCHRRIGRLALGLEILTALLFVVSYLFWPFGAADSWPDGLAFGLWLILLVGMIALTVYDTRWRLLPDKIMLPMMVIGLALGVVVDVGLLGTTIWDSFLRIILAMIPVAGFYGLLFLVSRGQLIGLGDVKFGAVVGLIVTWPAAALVLVLANVIGLVVATPQLISRRLTGKSQMAFGPMLIAATYLVFLFGRPILDFLGENLFLFW